MRKYLLSFCFILLMSGFSLGQTTLAPGDIAITGVNMDNPDEISVVFLVDIEIGTEIKFTDNGWKADNTWRANEGIYTWTAPSAYSAGDEIIIALSGPALSSSGDQVIAYQNTSDMVAAINDEGAHVWQADATSASTSALPQGLTNGTNCVALTETDNLVYDRSVTSGTRAELLTAINDYTNWSGDNSTRQTLSTAGFTITALGSPLITLAPLTLSDFGYVDGAGPSTEQSFNVSGSDLTDNISVTPPTNYEISLNSGGSFVATNPITLIQSGGSVSETPIYVRLKSGLSPGAYNSENITASSSGASDKTVTCSGTVYKQEPSDHVTSFSATANGNNQINLSWTDAIGTTEPDMYLIKGSDVSYAAITAPVDGTPEADDVLVKNVAQGVEAAAITGLSETTQYFFKIFPYTNSGPTIDYKTDGTVPQDDATTDAAPSLPNAWINEFHYDDAGSDADEFVEILIEDGSTYTLSDFQVNLYNGNGGGSYNSKTLDTYTVGDIINESGKTFNLYSFNYTTDGGVQNGGPDGLALSYQGTLIQFLSYEGSFAATDGPANGVTSTDIGVSESSANEGSSLGLEGTGTAYSDFTWVAFDASATPGSQNGNQALPVELTSFSASVIKNSVKLAWNTATEINNYGFEVQRSADEEVWSNIGFVNGNGTTNSPKDYLFVDDKLSNSTSYYYRLKQVDNDGSYEFSKTIEVVLGSPTEYELDQNYPNPFNPSTLISFTLPEAGFTNLVIFNSLGQEVATLVNDQLEAGAHQYNFNAKNLTSGIYFYKLESDNFVQVRKMMLLK